MHVYNFIFIFFVFILGREIHVHFLYMTGLRAPVRSLHNGGVVTHDGTRDLGKVSVKDFVFVYIYIRFFFVLFLILFCCCTCIHDHTCVHVRLIANEFAIN